MIAAVIACCLSLALTRAEIIERMRAPVITQADGMVRVFASCPDDMRREYQTPVSRFAADTVKALWRGVAKRPLRYRKPTIIVHVGDVRTNDTDVIVRTDTNAVPAVTRLYLVAPGFTDLVRFRMELVKAFYRTVEGRELSDSEATAAYRAANPQLRVEDERNKLEEWFVNGKGDFEEGLRRMRKIVEPGFASRRDVLIFASRLYLYPPEYDLKFLGRYRQLSFGEALALADEDPTIRLMAAVKRDMLPVFGGGRGDALTAAVYGYVKFLDELAKGESDRDELRALLDDADVKLNLAFEKARKENR